MFPGVTRPSALTKMDMYETTNSDYGICWEKSNAFCNSFSQSTPYKTLDNRRMVRPDQLPKDGRQMSLVHDPEHPCGIMSMSNIPMNVPIGEQRGMFTNVKRDLYSDRQARIEAANKNVGRTMYMDHGVYFETGGPFPTKLTQPRPYIPATCPQQLDIPCCNSRPSKSKHSCNCRCLTTTESSCYTSNGPPFKSCFHNAQPAAAKKRPIRPQSAYVDYCKGPCHCRRCCGGGRSKAAWN